MTTGWARHVAAWSHVPVDGVGYLSSARLLELPDAELAALVDDMRDTRYHGWRNAGGGWRAGLGLDELSGCDVLDYGCGLGLEAAELAGANRVWTADLHAANVALADRVARLRGVELQGGYVIGESYPFVLGIGGQHFDVIHSCGVLHHSRAPTAVLVRWRELLRPGGQARLLVYGPGMWRRAVGTEPPADVAGDPGFPGFLAYVDGVGDWADWYDPDRLAARAAGAFTVETCEYLADERFLTATLRRRS